MIKCVIATAVYSALSVYIACFGGVQELWSVETSEINEHEITAYHGETVEMSCQMLSYGRVVSGCGTAQFLWQTNGMGSAWWTTNAVCSSGRVKANWNPMMDVGADAYRFFFQVTDAKGANYRANGTISLLGSPYGDARYLPLPQKIIDFNQVTILNATNAPWAIKGVDSVTPSQVTNIAAVQVTNDVASWALKPNPAPVTDLTPAIAYTTAVSNKLEGAIEEKVGTNDVCNIVTNHATSGYLATELWVTSNCVLFAEDMLGFKTAIDIGMRTSTNKPGYASICRGVQSIASGTSSYASGISVTASGISSMAIGNQATASGENSIAQGYVVESSGNSSFAYGILCKAEHNYSFAWRGSTSIPTSYKSKGEGSFCIDPEYGIAGFWIGETNMYQHIANVNASVISNDFPAATYGVVGKKSAIALTNALTVGAFTDYSSYVGTRIYTNTLDELNSLTVITNKTKYFIPARSSAGWITNKVSSAKNDFYVMPGDVIWATDSLGKWGYYNDTPRATGLGAVAFGGGTANGKNAVAFGAAGAVGFNSFAHGGQMTQAFGSYSHAEGDGALAFGPNSHAEGVQTYASNTASHAEGLRTKALGNYSHSEGVDTTASGIYSRAEGEGTIAEARASRAFGNGTKARANYSVAGGYRAEVKSNAIYSVAYGDNTIVSEAATNAFALGLYAQANHNAAFVWSGNDSGGKKTQLPSKGVGTFNIYPKGGANGFFIDGSNFVDLVSYIAGSAPGSGAHPLAFRQYDFSSLKGLYVAVSNIVTALGGSVTNFPAFQN